MSQTPSFDNWWNTFDQRENNLDAYRGMAASGVAQNAGTEKQAWNPTVISGVDENGEMNFFGYAADVVKGVPRGIWGMADSVSEALYFGTGGFIGNTEREAPFGVEAWRGHSQTLPGGLVEGISQVAVPYVGGLKAVRATTGLAGLRGYGTAATAALGEQSVIAAAAGNVGRARLLAGASRGIEATKMAAEGVVAGFLADSVAFSSWAPRLSDLAIQSDNPLFNNALTQYLASDEDDSFLEGRLKNAIEGAFASGAIETIMGAARVVRAGNRAAKIGQDADSAMFAEHMKIRGEHREQLMLATGANADEAELINMTIDAVGMSRDKLSFAREAVQEFDERGQPRRAAVDFYEDGKTVIRFFETADRTSPVHEIAHVIRRRVLDRRIDPEYRMGISDQDIKLIEEYVGAREGNWDVNAEESWATLWERFTWDGIAPNRRVAAIMERSADFMRAVYSRVQADELLRRTNPEMWDANGGTKGFNINPEVRQVLNKLMSRAPVTVDDSVRTFVKARKRVAIPARGDFMRAVLANMDEGFSPRESAETIDAVYREERLYQSGSDLAKRLGYEVTDAGYPVKRGREAVIDRLRREVTQGDLNRTDAEAMERFINAMDPNILDVFGVRFRQSRMFGESPFGKSHAILGRYQFRRNIVEIAADFVRSTNVRETWTHEWGHAISSMLDPSMVKALKSDYERAYKKFTRLEGVDPRAKEGTEAFDKLKEWVKKNGGRWSELYSLTNLDEWLTVGFESAAWRQLDIQEGTRTYLGFARYAFHNMMLNIKSIWGGAVHERIARDLLDANFRASKKTKAAFMRKFKLGKFAPKPLVSETGEGWEGILKQYVDDRQRWMFRDLNEDRFGMAENARTPGELKAASTLYRNMNNLDKNLESRAYGFSAPPTPAPRQTLFQSSQPPAQPPQLSPMGGQPPQRPFNIERMSSVEDVRAYHDIRLQELEADGRVQYNSMDRAAQVTAAERELMAVADFTGYRTVPELTNALKSDEDALQSFMSKHLATRMILSEAGQQLINAREAALTSGAKQDMARYIAMQQRVDILLEHTRRNQATIARGLGAQNIIPGPGLGNVRLVDDAMLNDPKMIDDIIDASGGEAAVKDAMERSRAAEARGGPANAVRATQGGRHGVIPVLTEYWMNSILSGPVTFAVNVTSNTAAMLYAPLEQAIGAGIDRNFPLVKESMMRYAALATEIKESLAYAGVALKTGDNILDKVAPSGLSGNTARRDRAISAAAWNMADNSMVGGFVNFVGTVINVPGSALSATDEFFKQMNYRSTVKAGLIANAMQEVAGGRLARDQMGAWVETRFQRMVEQGQFYSERKIRADAANAAATEIKNGTFVQGSAEHMKFIKDYMRDNWNASDGELAKRARETAREATFTTPLRTDREGIEGISAKVQVLVGQHPSLRILIPFVRTPTNLALYFGQRTPISGVLYATPGLNNFSGRFGRDIASGDPVRRAQALGRVSAGTVITMSAIMAATTGVITGSGPKDPEERAYLMKSGWQPYSFKVGNTYVSYKKMDPFATFFGLAADLYEAYADSDDANKSAIEVTLKGLVAAVANNIVNKTYFTGLVSASNAISDAERYGANWLETFVGSFVPSLLSQSKDIIGDDPVMRDVQSLSEAIRNRIPGLSDTVAPRRDVLGEPIRRGRILGAVPPAWPFAYSQVNNDMIAREFAQLGAGFTPPRAMRNDVDLRAFVNNRGQNSYDRWQELTGQVELGGKTLRDSLEQLIESDGYQRMDPTSVEGYESPRVGMVRKVISRYRDAAFRETLQEFPDLMEAERQRRAAVIGASSGKPFSELLQYSR